MRDYFSRKISGANQKNSHSCRLNVNLISRMYCPRRRGCRRSRRLEWTRSCRRFRKVSRLDVSFKRNTGLCKKKVLLFKFPALAAAWQTKNDGIAINITVQVGGRFLGNIQGWSERRVAGCGKPFPWQEWARRWDHATYDLSFSPPLCILNPIVADLSFRMCIVVKSNCKIAVLWTAYFSVRGCMSPTPWLRTASSRNLL